MSRFRSADDVFAYLESFLNLERGTYNPREYRLERMGHILAAFDNPHLAYRVIHVAGSKGKGSVCAFAAACCAAAGNTVGIYASPHVSDYRERIRLVGGALTPDLRDKLVVEAGEEIAGYVEMLPADASKTLPTTFELLTLLGFLVFRAAKVDIAAVEVGLGGRLDATNLVAPAVTVITPIELEHTDYLGTTLAAVAGEKGGIIKQGIPLVLARQESPAHDVLVGIAGTRSAPLILAREAEIHSRPGVPHFQADIECADGLRITAELQLRGAVQAENAAVAVLAVRSLLPHITARELSDGLARAWLPGRCEVVDGKPPVLLDGAHTPSSIRTVLEVARTLEPDAKNRTLIYGSAMGKEHRIMLDLLVPEFHRIIISRPGTFKPSDTAELERICLEAGGNCERHDEMEDALAAARQTGAELIVVTGSFYLVGEARPVLVIEEAP